MSKPKAFSFSQLNNFETCPRKYYELSVAKNFKEVEGEAILYGKRVHKAFELLVSKGKPLPPEFSHMLPYVQKFVDFPGTKLVEQQLCITSDFKPTHWKDWDNGWCRAIIDLALVGKNSAVLIDYKTGKMKDDGFVQLMLAAALFMIHHPEVENVDVGYLWTQEDGQITRDSYDRGDIAELWNELLPRVDRFQRAFQQTDYPPRPSGLCRKWCIVETCVHHGQ
jgi:CRISPR/Cas system-associated exonuclease Cas4 (RecB family)